MAEMAKDEETGGGGSSQTACRRALLTARQVAEVIAVVAVCAPHSPGYLQARLCAFTGLGRGLQVRWRNVTAFGIKLPMYMLAITCVLI